MWGPIIEKAWAKVKGSYSNADGGLVENGIRSLTGAPVYLYQADDQVTTKDLKNMYKLLQSADKLGYLMGAGTDGTSDKDKNSCGVSMAHAFSIIATFKMEEDDGTQHDMILVRNPWGETDYSWHWHRKDKRWTNALVR